MSHCLRPIRFNGATTFQSWICSSWLSEMRGSLSFNGATTFQSWICWQKDHGQNPEALRFNGATTFQSWIWVCPGLLCVKPTRFNGATTFQSWISRIPACLFATIKLASMGPRLFSRGYPVDFCFVEGTKKLQWGHDFSVVDMTRTTKIEADY